MISLILKVKDFGLQIFKDFIGSLEKACQDSCGRTVIVREPIKSAFDSRRWHLFILELG